MSNGQPVSHAVESAAKIRAWGSVSHARARDVIAILQEQRKVQPQDSEFAEALFAAVQLLAVLGAPGRIR